MRIIVAETYIIYEIAQTAKRQDEKVDFLNENALARSISIVEVVLDLASHSHDCVGARRLSRAVTARLWCFFKGQHGQSTRRAVLKRFVDDCDSVEAARGGRVRPCCQRLTAETHFHLWRLLQTRDSLFYLLDTESVREI